jgi:DinB superfamily
MNPESNRIADQLRRAFAGDPWHGDPLRTLLTGISAEQALARPLPESHCIWELVLHIELYVRIAYEATKGSPMPKLYGTGHDWTVVDRGDAAEWAGAIEQLIQSEELLAAAIEEFPDARLPDTVPGRAYDFYYLFHGIVQHSLYHGGQIAMLKRAV